MINQMWIWGLNVNIVNEALKLFCAALEKCSESESGQESEGG